MKGQLMICYVWTHAIAICIPRLFVFAARENIYGHTICDQFWTYPSQSQAYLLSYSILTILGPLLVTCMAYYLVWRAFRTSQRKVNDMTTLRRPKTLSRMPYASKTEIRLLKTLLLMVSCFVLLWTPYLVYLFISQFSRSSFASTSVYFILTSTWIRKFQPVLDPLIYGYLNKQFRQTFFEMLDHCATSCVRSLELGFTVSTLDRQTQSSDHRSCSVIGGSNSRRYRQSRGNLAPQHSLHLSMEAHFRQVACAPHRIPEERGNTHNPINLNTRETCFHESKTTSRPRSISQGCMLGLTRKGHLNPTAIRSMTSKEISKRNNHLETHMRVSNNTGQEDDILEQKALTCIQSPQTTTSIWCGEPRWKSTPAQVPLLPRVKVRHGEDDILHMETFVPSPIGPKPPALVQRSTGDSSRYPGANIHDVPPPAARSPYRLPPLGGRIPSSSPGDRLVKLPPSGKSSVSPSWCQTDNRSQINSLSALVAPSVKPRRKRNKILSKRLKQKADDRNQPSY